MRNEDINISDILNGQINKNEYVLWYGKPSMYRFFFAEIIPNIIDVIAIIILIPIFLKFIKYASYSYEQLTYWIMSFIIAIVIFIVHNISWYKRKRSTYFVITNHRVFDIYIKSQEYIFHSLLLEDIKNFELRKVLRGWNLHLGKYRYGNPMYFDYEFSISDRNDRGNFESSINNIDFFSFFDLDNPDTPVRYIRQITNAKEYIDPLKKK